MQIPMGSTNEMEDSDEYDEFLFESIHRYNTLQMFNLENTPEHLVRINETSLCVSSRYEKRNASELLILQLPEKLILPAEEEGRSKGNDFKVLEGLYTENSVYKIDNIFNTEKIVTSECNVIGLKVYTLGRNKPGKNEETNLNIVPWSKSEFVVIKETNHAVCSKCCHEPLIQIDITAGKRVKEIKHPTIEISPDCSKDASCGANNMKCSIMDENSIAVLNTQVGDVYVHDLRTDDCFTSLPKMKKKHSNEIWVLSDCDYHPKDCNYLGTLSSRKSVCIFDKRKNCILVEDVGTEAPNAGNMKMKFSKIGDRFSMSGLDSVVEVYQIAGSNIQNIFTHNGHSPSKSTVNTVTDHIWLQTISKEYIVSICDNKTLNCWDYNAK